MSDGVSRIVDDAYLTGDTFSLPVGDPGTDWIAPSAVPVMPNGQQAVRVAFLPVSCATFIVAITADPAPDDDWVKSLRQDSSQHSYEFESWPGPQTPTCANGHVTSYLQVDYRPFVPGGTVHVVASIRQADNAPTVVDVVPVFTSVDASQPSLAADGYISLTPIAGPEKLRSARANQLFSTDFTHAILPDGTAPTHWGFMVTGCGPIGRKPIVITARVGAAAPVVVGTCTEGSFTVDMTSLPLPADGTRIALLIAGGTTKSHVRVSQFEWRGDRQ